MFILNVRVWLVLIPTVSLVLILTEKIITRMWVIRKVLACLRMWAFLWHLIASCTVHIWYVTPWVIESFSVKNPTDSYFHRLERERKKNVLVWAFTVRETEKTNKQLLTVFCTHNSHTLPARFLYVCMFVFSIRSTKGK